jgi:hypothetical protein
MADFLRLAFRHVCCFAVFLAATASQAEPEVRAVSLRGLQIGGTTTIRVDGTGLLPQPQLALSVPIAKQVVKPGATATRVEFEVTLDENTEPGLVNLWLTSGEGVSQPTVIAIDRLSELLFAPELKALPVALHGAVRGSARMRTTFAARKDQAVLVEVEAQRLGGKLRPVLHIYNEENRQLAWTLPSPSLRGDARLTFTPPADGNYTVELHDLEYAAPAPNFFRLKIGNWEYADLVFPPAVQAGTKRTLTLISGSANGQTIEYSAPENDSESVRSAPWKNIATSAGFRPPVVISSYPEIIESPAKDSPLNLPAIPSGVSGRFLEPGEQDVFQLDVTPGTKLRFEVFADRIGSPIDASLEIQNEKGARLAANDDIAGTPDPRIDYTVPANVKRLRIAVKDTNGRGGPNCIYRIAVTPVPGSGPADFQLQLAQQRQSVASGDRLVVKVTATRTGYRGPIDLKFDSLPEGFQIQGARIADGSSATLMTLHGAGAGLSSTLTKLRGMATIDGRRVERLATVSTHVVGKIQPWLSHEIGLATTSPAASGFKADWGTIGLDTKLVLSDKLELPVKVARPPGFDGPVRLMLQTSQLPVMAGNRVDANRTLRSLTNAPIELAADANAQKAWDAKIAADKVVADVIKAQAMVSATGKQEVATAAAAAKKAAAELASLKVQSTKVTAVAKAAGDADAAAQKTLVDATARMKATAKAADEADAAKLEKVARAAVSAAAAAKAAADQKAATAKTLATASAAAKTAADAVANAEKVSTQAAAALKAAMDITLKANAAEAAKVKEATAKQTAAVQVAKNASALARNEGTFSIFVPAELKESGYEFALQAELLSRDKRTVVARSFTSLRRFGKHIPLSVSLAADSLVSKIDPKAGATVSIAGKIERHPGTNQDVTVTLSGLPGGVAVPKAVVKTGQTDFKLDVKFPANFKPAEINTIRVFATGKFLANSPLPVRSEDTAVSVKLEAAVPPAKAS